MVDKLAEGPCTEAGRHLANASLANKALRTAVADSDSAAQCLRQAPLVQKVRRLARELASNKDLQPSEGELCLTALRLLGPQDQDKVISSVLALVKHKPDDPFREDIERTQPYP